MENRRQAHLRRVNRKGRTTKDSFEIGEFVRMQNIQTKVWDTQGEITGTRVAANGRIVSYDLIINGRPSTRHRKFLQKIHLPKTDESGVENSGDDSDIPDSGGDVEDIHADRRVSQGEQAGAGQARPGGGDIHADRRVSQGREQARPGQVRHSPRLQNRAEQGTRRSL